MKTKPILVLNKYHMPAATSEKIPILGNIWSGSMIPLDIYYEENDDGCVDLDNISWYREVRDLEEWKNMPIRPYDDYIHTVRGPIRLPSVVICSNYDRVPYRKAMFPTKQNIHKRDNFTCQYTGIPLTKENLSIDHIFPKVRCAYNPNTWENQVSCHKELNTWKDDRLPEECFLRDFKPVSEELIAWKKTNNSKTLKLLKYPTRPVAKNVFTFGDTMESWNIFLKDV